jgi:hypothetical protein
LTSSLVIKIEENSGYVDRVPEIVIKIEEDPGYVDRVPEILEDGAGGFTR